MIQSEFEAVLKVFEAALYKSGIKVKRVSGFRSYAEQDALYSRGRTKPGPKITNGRGGQSWHNFGLAMDYAFIVNKKVTWVGPWPEFGRLAVQCGLEWGGNFDVFPDRPHVQMRHGKSLREMRESKRDS